MASHFARLSLELMLNIIGFLEFSDKLALSSTCAQLRVILLPDIFACIRVTNDESKAGAVLDLVAKHGSLVKKLNIVARDDVWPDDGGSDGDSDINENDDPTKWPLDTRLGNNTLWTKAVPSTSVKARRLREWLQQHPVVPHAIKDLIGGKNLPSLVTIQVYFDLDWDNRDHWLGENEIGGFYLFGDSEPPEFAPEKEAQWKWRALMAETWKAVSKNMTVRKLIVQKLVPKFVSTFSDVEWKRFLGRLEEFNVSFLFFSNGVEWQMNTNNGYLDVVSSMDSCFFNHLGLAEKVAFIGDGPIGLHDTHLAPLPFKRDCLPTLKTLELTKILISVPLADFLGAKASLRSVRLLYCAAAYYVQGTISWAEFFARWRRWNPIINEFALISRRIQLNLSAILRREPQGSYVERRHAEAQEALQRLESDAELKWFHYASVDRKYGGVYDYYEESMDAFNLGDDQKEYSAFMKLVKSNAERL